MSVAASHPWSSLPWFEATARGLVGSTRIRWVQWSLTHSLYGPLETTREEQALRNAVGRECGGWANETHVPSLDVDCEYHQNWVDRIEDAEEMTLNEIGESLGLSRERVRGIEATALRTLRKRIVGSYEEPFFRDDTDDSEDSNDRERVEPPTLRCTNCTNCTKQFPGSKWVSEAREDGSRSYFCNPMCRNAWKWRSRS